MKELSNNNRENNENKNYEVEEKDISALEQGDILQLMDMDAVKDGSELLKKGFISLLDGYLDYAKEVLINRALPNLYDGLKPVQRYGLWVMHLSKKKDFQKSEKVSGSIMEYHPHNADSAYEAMTKMVDSNGEFPIPLLVGDGSLGKVYSNGPAAARRYTSIKLHDNAKEMFSAMDGINMVDNFDSTAKEPDVLPASMPYVLMKPTEGIAVGFATQVFSFNGSDVIKLVKERIEMGQCVTKIVPDFPTGGYIIPTEKELDKLMRTGKGKFVVRGRVEVDGKVINIKEVPHGTTIEKLKKEIDKANIKGVVGEASILTDISGAHLSVTCSSKSIVDVVLAELYSKTPLQSNANSNLLTIADKKLVITGVWGIIDRWVEWRRAILSKQISVDLEKAKQSIRFVEAFIKLLSIEGAREEVIHEVTKVSDESAIRKIMEYVDCKRDVADWIIKRRLNQFRNGAKYKDNFDDLTRTIKELESELANVDKVILADMDRIERTITSKYPRKTEISNTVYKSVKDVAESEEETVYNCFYEIKNGFIKKSHAEPQQTEDSIIINGFSNSVIIAISNLGEIYRVYGEDLEFSTYGAIGTFIPNYSGIPNATDVTILWGTAVDGNKYVLTYEDGFVGFLDTTEFQEGSIKSRYLRNGISEHAHLLTDVKEYKHNSAILAQTHSNRFAVAYLDSMKMKSRTARTRVWQSEEIYDTFIVPMSELKQRIPSYDKLLVKKPVVFNGRIDLTSDLNETEEVEVG